MSRQKLLIATTNDGKKKEIEMFLETGEFDLMTLQDLDSPPVTPEETGDTLFENAVAKARYYGEQTGLVTLADDAGLFIDALDGWPGVASARIAEDTIARRDLVLEKLAGKQDRGAAFRVVLAIYDPRDKSVFTMPGELRGTILEQPVEAGEIKWGYNGIFYVNEAGKSYQEMTIQEKNEMSHRGKALNQIKHYLNNRYGAKQIVAPISLIVRDGKVLMIQRNDPHRPEYHRKWEFPGGGVDFGETVHENLIRETKEEAGYEIEPLKLLKYIHTAVQEYPTFKYQVFLLPYLCKIVSGNGEYSDAEALDAQWFELDDVLNHELVGENARVYEKILDQLKASVKEFGL